MAKESRVNERLLLGAMAVVMLVGCGRAVNPDEVNGPSCTSDVCWDLSQTSALRVNDYPFVTSLAAKEAHGWRFATTPGHRYTVRVKVTSGRTNTYVSPNVVIDPKANTLTDYGSTRGLTFTAERSEAYIAVEDTGNTQGSVYGVRVVSYDEARDPLPGTTFLLVNGDPMSFRLIPHEVARVVFSGTRGQDYAIKVRLDAGSTDTFLSRIPSVDAEVYDLADTFSNSDIRFRAAETSLYYVAVADRGNVTGSDFTIQITSP